PETVELAKVKPLTWEPLIPSAALFLTTMSVKLGAVVDDNAMPEPAEPWIVPPVPADPVPVTVSPPDEPVEFSEMPGLAPLDEMLWNFRPLAPMVVLWTVSAVAVVVVIVLPEALAVTVPPPVAEKAVCVPVLSVSTPAKPIEAPVLPDSEIPVPLSVMLPLMPTTPPVWLAIETE